MFYQTLTESIAIAHELGHTPFGYVGERKLDEILQSGFLDVGGFKHNYQRLSLMREDISFQI